MTSTTITPEVTLSMPPRPPYPNGIPNKFSSEGLVQRFPGNTAICHLPVDSPLLPGLQAVHAALSSHPTLFKLIHLLPPASWHMTVFEGVCEKARKPGMWPVGRDKQSLPDCTADFATRLRQFGLGLEEEGLAPPYKMQVRSFDDCVVGVGLEIVGATEEEEKRMRRLRDRIADALDFRAPNHETYRFHVSIAYLMRYIEGKDRQELNRVLAQLLPDVQLGFELGAVEFCTFENMYAFSRQFFLGERE